MVLHGSSVSRGVEVLLPRGVSDVVSAARAVVPGYCRVRRGVGIVAAEVGGSAGFPLRRDPRGVPVQAAVGPLPVPTARPDLLQGATLRERLRAAGGPVVLLQMGRSAGPRVGGVVGVLSI